MSQSALVNECANATKALKEQLDTIPTDFLKTSINLPGSLLPVEASKTLLLLEATLIPFHEDPVSSPAVQNFLFASALPPAIGEFPQLANLESNPTDTLIHLYNIHETRRIRRKAELLCATTIVQALSRIIGTGFNDCILAPFTGALPAGAQPPSPSLLGVTPWAAKTAFTTHYRVAVSATLNALERQLTSPMADDMSIGVHLSRYDIKVREMNAIGGISRALSVDQSWRHTQNFIASISHLARYAPFIQAYTDTGHTTDDTRLWPDFKIWALHHAPAYEQHLASTAYNAAHSSASAAAGPIPRAPAARPTISLPVTTTGRISVDALKQAAANQGYILTPSKTPYHGARQPFNRNVARDRPPPAAPLQTNHPQRPYHKPRQQYNNAALPRPRGNVPQRQRRANAVTFEADDELDASATDTSGYDSTYDQSADHYAARAAYFAEDQTFDDDDEASATEDPDGDAHLTR